MKNRITNDLSPSAPEVSLTPTGWDDLLHAGRNQRSQRGQWVKRYIQDHPAVGLGAALSIGVVIGWINKRR
jgi:ElaB/YqjD/DUF883 family membrane-anchored ribosome-binding protein